MKNQIKRVFNTGLLFLVVSFGLAQSAFAARYLVVFKNKEAFFQTHAQLMIQNTTNLASVRLTMENGNPSTQVKAVVVEESLQNINSLVVNSFDDSSVQALLKNSNVAIVEQEIFHKAPTPIGGYQRTLPGTFSLNYATIKDNEELFVGGVGSKTPWGIQAVKAPQAWSSAKSGAGARVLVLDTGLDKDHPAVKAAFEKGRDFVNDNNKPYDIADHVGHGTHVSGTIAASLSADGFVGVAPKAKILTGRVCSEEGCSNIAVAQGINWGISEKVDVINMSLGGAQATAAEQRAVMAADRAGITIVAASGNDGTPEVSYPAAFAPCIAVGAVDKTMTKAKFSQWGPQLTIMAPGVDVVSSVPVGMGKESKVVVSVDGQTKEVLSTTFAGAPDVLVPASSDLVFVNLGKPDDYKAVSVTGKFALVKRGEISFGDKVKNAISAGAAGVVIFNNEPGLLEGAITQDGSIVAVPVVMIEQVAGESLARSFAANQKVSATLQTVSSDYSSYAGTSMATPHVAGVVALMKAANKSLKPAQVKQIIIATATSLEPKDENQTGSGFINAEKAVQQSLVQ